MITEQRKEMRLLPQGHTFVVLRPHFSQLGKLIEISRKGLSFTYTAHQQQEEDSTHLDLFISNNKFYLPRLPCEVIYDIKFIKNETVFASLEYRRCGLEFGELTQEQAAQLELYIKNHTAGTG